MERVLSKINSLWNSYDKTVYIGLIIVVSLFIGMQFATRNSTVEQTHIKAEALGSNVSANQKSLQELENIVQDITVSREEIIKVVTEEIDVTALTRLINEQATKVQTVNRAVEILAQNTPELPSDIVERIETLNTIVITGELKEKADESTEQLEETNELIQLNLEIQQAAAEEIAASVEAEKVERETQEVLQFENLQELIQSGDLTLEQKIEAITQRITDVENVIITINADLQAHLDLDHAFVPVGGIVWVTGTEVPDTEFYAECDGAAVPGGTLPDINANGLFIRGGVFDGIENPFTTSGSGLAAAGGGAHSHTFPNPNDFDTGVDGGGALGTFHLDAFNSADNGNTSTAPVHGHSISGAAETAPVSMIANCYVRIL